MNNNLCPLCGNADIKKKYTDAQIPVWQCDCGAVFLSPFPSTEKLKQMYGQDYYNSWGLSSNNEAEPREMKKATFISRMRRISKFLKKGKVLDVGCATGYFLEVASDAGWDVYGVEVSEFSSRLARNKFGYKIFNGTLEQARFADNTFDLITLSDLLEHIRDLDTFLGEVIRILKPNGLLMIVTPNVASLSRLLMGARWSHYKEEHLYYFSPATVKKLLEKNGLSTLLVKPSYKYLNPAYVINQFRIYHHPVLSPLINGMGRLMPSRLKQVNFPVFCGEMMVLAKKR